MATNRKQASPSVASLAGKTLQTSGASQTQKTVAGSALRQSGSRARTGAQTEATASKALGSSRSAPITKTLAGSVVSQSNRKH